MLKKIGYSTAILLLFNTQAATAAISDNIHINGFLTAAVAKLDEEANLAGVDDEASFDALSVFGLQLSVDVDDRLSITTQLLGRGIDDYNIEAEWAFAKYKINDTLDIRAGKMRLPYFFYSDYLDVGHTYPWITPPIEAYGSMPTSIYNGVDLLYYREFGDYTVRFQPFVGQSNDRIRLTTTGEEADLTFDNMRGIILHATDDTFTFRLMVEKHSLTLGLEDTPTTSGLFDALLANGFPDVVEQMNAHDEDVTFLEAGFSYDEGNVLVIGEWTSRDIDGSVLPEKATGYYATFGYRFGEWMPHITFSKEESDVRPEITAPFPSDVPELAGLISTVEAARQSGDLSQESVTIGLRYDFTENAALKFEWKHVKSELGVNSFGTTGLLTKVSPDYDGNLDQLGMALSVVF
ncbi:MAG: hypothetical protein ACI9FJ_001171 [Alteromonadaceae bacterium]|jgi:hypothetical protein